MAENVQYILSLKDLFSQTIKDANKEADKFETKVNSLQGSLTKLAGAVGIAFSVSAISSFGQSVVETGAKFEKAEIGLSTLLKSSVEGHAAFEQIKKDVATTPFGIESLLMANKALIGTKMSAGDARRDVLNLANAIAATGGGDDELTRMSANMMQIRNTGKATAMDIKQFAYAGVNIYQLLADATGKTVEETKDLEVSYDMLAYALQKAHDKGGLYEGGLEKLNKSTSLQISNIGDAILLLKDDIFKALKPEIDGVIQSIGGFIENLKQAVAWATTHGTEIKTLGIGIIGLTLALNANNIAWAITQVKVLGASAALAIYEVATFASIVATEGLSAALYAAGITGATAWGLMTGGLTIVAAGLYYAWQKSEQFRGGILGIWEVIKSLGQPLMKVFQAMIMPSPENIMGAINAFKQVDFKKTFEIGYAKGKNKEETPIQPVGSVAGSSSSNLSLSGGGLPSTTTKSTGSGSSSRSKSNVINVNIGKLVEGLTIKVENSTEGYEQMKEKITQYIVSAINDSVIIAGGL